MKKKVASIAFIATSILATTFSANAQEGLILGTEGTPQMSWLLNKDDINNSNFKYENTFDVCFGMSSQYGFDKNMGIGLNVLYSFQGQRYKLNGVERIKKVDYLKVPLMFVYCYEINSKFMLTGKVGPQLDLLMNARLTDKDGKNIVSDQKKAYEDYEIAAVASAGIGYKLIDNLFLDAAFRYDYAFTDAENKSYQTHINNPLTTTNGNGTSTRKITNNETLGITVGIRYLIKMKKENSYGFNY